MTDSQVPWDDGPIEVGRKRTRRRLVRMQLVYLILVIVLAIVGWRLVPQEVKDAVRRTYIDTQLDPLAEPETSNAQ